MSAASPLVGRDSALDALLGALDEAAAGRGGLWLVHGDAGIGKSRLAEELAVRAGTVLWGRCWEGGGAPAYWPWIQVLRALLRGGLAPQEPRREILAQILPELGPAAPAEGDRARFALWDAAAATLCEAAAPTVVVVEDLHAADAASLQLLEVLAMQARSAPVLVVGTHRDAGDGAAMALLARAARAASTLALAPLTETDTRAWLEAVVPGCTPDLVRSIHGVSEGSPLYIRELVNWVTSGNHTSLPHIPGSLREAIHAELLGLAPPLRARLADASVLGREWRLDDLAALRGEAVEDCTQALASRGVAAVATESAPRTWRFTHVLLRDVLYDDLPPDRRRALHLRAADVRAGSAGAEPPWTEVAHHLLAAGAWPRALEAAACAGEAAMRQFAFDDAATWWSRALDALERADGSPERRAEVLVELGRAKIRAGRADEGLPACREAAHLAREAGNGPLLARAALAYGERYVFGHVDPILVSLLREGLEALGDARDSGLRARALARLAGALQPAVDPSEPIALAREAIAMARRLGEPATLLEVLRAGVSALMDIADEAERLPLNREMVALAERLGAHHEAFQGNLRLVFDAHALADVRTAHAAAERCAALADRVGPGAQWRVHALRALEATRVGRLDEADDHRAAGRSTTGARSDIDATRAFALQELCGDLLRQRYDAVDQYLAAGGVYEAPQVMQQVIVPLVTTLSRGRALDAAALRRAAELAVMVADRSLLELVAHVAMRLRDPLLARHARDGLSAYSGRFVSWGVMAMALGPPVDRLLGALEAVLGEHDASDGHFEAALELARTTGDLPHAAWTALEHAESLFARSEDARAAALFAEAAALSEGLGLDRLTARIPTARPKLPPTTKDLALVCEGSVWTVSGHGARFHLPDMRGLQWIARLVARPGEEIHVLDLVDEGKGAVDLGDAGEKLDDRAIAAYRARARALQEDLEEAEDWNDRARAERVREELAFLEAELRGALGLGGRKRRTGKAAERARINVRRRIKHAVDKIAEHSPALARHLERSLRTGTFCSYAP